MDLPGDAQFGMHGAMALGWMMLEGTKALDGLLFKNGKDTRLAATKLKFSLFEDDDEILPALASKSFAPSLRTDDI